MPKTCPPERRLRRKQQLQRVKNPPQPQAAQISLPDTTGPPILADDLLIGAMAIAAFVFGRAEPAERRRVYWLAETAELPIFRLGSMICARKSRLLQHIAEREVA